VYACPSASEGGQIVCSGAVQALLGYASDEFGFDQQSYLDLVHPADRAAVESQLRQSSSQPGPFTRTYRLKRKDLKYAAILDRGVSLADEAGGVRRTVGVLAETTEALRLAGDARRNAHFLETLLDLIPSPVFCLDGDGRYRYCNRAQAQEVLGLSVDQVVGKTMAELSPTLSPEFSLLHQKFHLELLHHGGVRRYEVLLRNAEGVPQDFLATKSVLVGENGQTEGIITLLSDITERRRMEQTLAGNQRRLAQAMDIAQLACWQHELDQDAFTFNDRFYALHGTTAQREGGYVMSTEVYFREFIPPEDVSEVRSAMMRGVNAKAELEIFECEHRVRRRDGQVRHLLVRAVIQRDGQGRGVSANGTTQDITLRRKAEDDFNKLWMAVEQNPSVVVITDTAGRVEYVNRQFVETTGLSPTEVSGQIPPVFNLKWHEAAVYQQLWDTLKAGQPWRGELCSQKRDGSPFYESILVSPVRDQSGRVTHFISVQEDITLRRQVAEELKRTDEALRQQAALLRSVASSTPFSFYVADPGADKVLYHNRKFVEAWGLEDLQDKLARHEIKHGEVIGRLSAAAANPEDFARHRQCLADPKDSPVLEGDILLRNGRILHHLAQQILDDHGRFLGRLSVFEDVTQQKQASQRLSASLNQKEVLLREVYHRVKNNLQVISSLLNLQSVSINDPEMLGLLRETQDRVRSMALVHEKLYRADDLAKIDFADYARQLVAMLARSYRPEGSGVNLRFALQKILLNLDTSIPCGLILNELVSNAFKYAFTGLPDGSPPEIKVELRVAEPGTFVLVVADNGVGLPVRIDVFHTESLGLQVVSMLAEQLSGTIEVDRTRGTSFKLTFREIRGSHANRPAAGAEAGANLSSSKVGGA
jgi:PAS domain S-box-containing protein